MECLESFHETFFITERGKKKRGNTCRLPRFARNRPTHYIDGPKAGAVRERKTRWAGKEKKKKKKKEAILKRGPCQLRRWTCAPQILTRIQIAIYQGRASVVIKRFHHRVGFLMPDGTNYSILVAKRKTTPPLPPKKGSGLVFSGMSVRETKQELSDKFHSGKKLSPVPQRRKLRSPREIIRKKRSRSR